MDEKHRGKSGKQSHEIPKSESMLLDDTKYTTYIHDIDRELEDTETQEDHISFLPDIEKALTAIPRAILERPSTANNELVLYRTPAYFTLPVEKSQAKRSSTDTVSSPKPSPLTVNRGLRRTSLENIDEHRLFDAQDDMDIDL